jgi:signal transduction histidine kinase
MGKAGLAANCKFKVHHPILARSVAELTTSDEFWQFITQTMSAAATALRCGRASLFLFDEEIGQLRLALVIEDGRASLSGAPELLAPFPAEELGLWKVLSVSRKPSWQRLPRDAVRDQPWLSGGSPALEKVLGIPLNIASRLIGLWCFGFTKEQSPASEQVELAASLSAQAALAIQFLKINEQVLEIKKLRRSLAAVRKAHEGLAQYLATVSLYLAAAESQVAKNPGIAANAVQKAQELSQHGMKLAANTNVILGAGRNQPKNLAAALRVIAQESQDDSSTAIQFLEYGRPFPALTPEVIKALAEIMREAIHNGIRHGKANRIIVTLSWYVEKLSLHIVDNGSGFDLREAKWADQGYGMSGMHEQVRRIRGRLEVTSAPGQGTELRCVIPIVNI